MIDDQILAKMLRKFAGERNWEQFHTPKNIAAALSVEVAELLEIFQWSRGQKGWHELDDETIRTQVKEELADIFLYLIRFADLANINLEAAAIAKIKVNAKKYPVQSAKGSDRKYNEHE